jgi:signal transduction histidine kinase
LADDAERLALFDLALWKLVDIHFPGHHWLESVSESKPDLIREIHSYLESDISSWARDLEKIRADANRVLELVSNSAVDPSWIDRAGQLRRSFQDCALKYSNRLRRERPPIPAVEWFQSHELKPQPIYAEKLIAPLISSADKMARSRGASVSAHVGEGLGSVKVDPEGFRQMFSNMLLNAVQALRKGDAIRLEVRRDKEQVFFILIQEAVSPSGLFAPFFSTKSVGTGLGLAIASRLFEDIVGRLGATLSFTAGPRGEREIALGLPVVN